MPKDNKIKPSLPGGFRDTLPDEFARREWVLERAIKVYRSFGFKPLDTSAVEYFQTISGGDETSKQIYRMFNHTPDMTGESLALRFDLTVSLARIIAANRKSFTFPFKRFQIGEVWRGERQQRGRFKQFLQFDADIVGTASPSADAEIVMLIAGTMSEVGLPNFTIRINNRKILNGFIRSLGLDETDVNPFLRILDKLERIGWDGVSKMLAAEKPTIEEMNAGAEGMGLDDAAVAKVNAFLNLPKDNNSRIEFLQDILRDSAAALEGIAEIEKILMLAKASGVTEQNLSFDPSIARGLDYYTGPVFETILNDLPSLGSVMSGGRYDNLVERFSNESIPATGISLGVDRLLVGLEELGLMNMTETSSKVLVAGLGDETESYIFNLASKLRAIGVSAEVYLGENRSLKKQMTYANRNNILYCVVIGPEEMEKGTAQVKMMTTSDQREYAMDELMQFFSRIADH